MSVPRKRQPGRMCSVEPILTPVIRKVKTVRCLKTGELKEIVELIPETEEDFRELDRLVDAGLVDDRDAFSDSPESWED